MAKRVLGIPEGAVQAFLLVWGVMCTEPSLMTEELHYCRALLLPVRNICQSSRRHRLEREGLMSSCIGTPREQGPLAARWVLWKLESLPRQVHF